MSLILKGIDLPSKVDLDYHDNHLVLGGICYALDVDQLVQIPKGHGNIIDESKAVVTETIDGYYEITAPTILEAEEE